MNYGSTNRHAGIVSLSTSGNRTRDLTDHFHSRLAVCSKSDHFWTKRTRQKKPASSDADSQRPLVSGMFTLLGFSTTEYILLIWRHRMPTSGDSYVIVYLLQKECFFYNCLRHEASSNADVSVRIFRKWSASLSVCVLPLPMISMVWKYFFFLFWGIFWCIQTDWGVCNRVERLRPLKSIPKKFCKILGRPSVGIVVRDLFPPPLCPPPLPSVLLSLLLTKRPVCVRVYLSLPEHTVFLCHDLFVFT